MSELKYWLWLSALEGVRPRTKTLALAHFASPRALYFAPKGGYEELGIPEGERAALENKELDTALGIIDACAEKGIGIITLGDAAYPRRLANIYDPPVVLYVRGRLPAVDEEAAVAVVGTRGATPYGVKMASRMGYELTKCGGLVVSGLTQGVDGAAARGAFLAGGECIGVLGTPIDSDWGGDLARDAETAGALVSEYPPGAHTFASNFRARNRITSGLSIAVVVVEAPEGSGALLFADEASEQGREICVVPANADAPPGAGSNALLKDGARPVTGGWDVLADYEGQFPQRIAKPAPGRGKMPIQQERELDAEKSRARPVPPETGEDFAVLREPVAKKGVDKKNTMEYIDLKKQLESLPQTELDIIKVMTEPSMHVDDIIDLTGQPAASVLAELTMLQIKGFVRQEPGKRFTLNIKK